MISDDSSVQTDGNLCYIIGYRSSKRNKIRITDITKASKRWNKAVYVAHRYVYLTRYFKADSSALLVKRVSARRSRQRNQFK